MEHKQEEAGRGSSAEAKLKRLREEDPEVDGILVKLERAAARAEVLAKKAEKKKELDSDMAWFTVAIAAIEVFIIGVKQPWEKVSKGGSKAGSGVVLLFAGAIGLFTFVLSLCIAVRLERDDKTRPKASFGKRWFRSGYGSTGDKFLKTALTLVLFLLVFVSTCLEN